MPNPVKSLGYIKCDSSSRLLKPLAILSDSTIRSSVDREDLKPYRKSEEKATFLQVKNHPIISTFFKDFTNHRKKTNRALVFSCRPFPNILKYRDYRRNLLTIWKTRPLQALMEEFR